MLFSIGDRFHSVLQVAEIAGARIGQVEKPEEPESSPPKWMEWNVIIAIYIYYSINTDIYIDIIIIGLPRVYCEVGKTVCIGRLADPLDLR